MRRLLSFPSVAACARDLGMDRHSVHKRVKALVRKGAPVTAETILEGYAPRAPSKRVPVLGCASIVAAAKRHKLSRATLWERVETARRERKPLTKAVLIDAYGPTGRRPGRPLGIGRLGRERDAARILDAWAARRAA